jgi:hypothetical protein
MAVLEYCAALADEEAAETLRIPVLKADGSRGTAMMLVGPASQIVAQDAETPFEELVDPETVALLTSRTRAHRPVVYPATSAPDVAEYDQTMPHST